MVIKASNLFRTFIPSGRMSAKHGTGLSLYLVRTMSINLIRFLASQKKRAERYHTDALRYRGVVYKEID